MNDECNQMHFQKESILIRLNFQPDLYICVFCSAQRLHALQLELTSVQLLREQLEESIKHNKELRDELESEVHRAKLREGAVQIH